MAPSAAHVVSALVAEVCDVDSNELSVDELISMESCPDVHCAIASAPNAAHVAAEWERTVQAGARQLGALGPRLAGAVLNAGAAALLRIKAHCTVACRFACELIRAADILEMVTAEQALHSSAVSLLRCGHALMSTRQSDSSSAGAAVEAQLLKRQALLLYNTMQFSLLRPAGAAHLAAQLAPRELLAWLSAAAGRLATLPDSSYVEGSADAVQACLTLSIGAVTNGDPNYHPHVAALKRDTRLQGSLMQLLVRALHTTAATVQLPPDRHPAWFDWSVPYALTLSLITQPLLAKLLEALQRSDADFSSSTGQHRVLQSAAQVIAAAPASCPGVPSAALANLWSSLFHLLGVTCSETCISMEQQLRQRGRTRHPPTQLRQMLSQLLLALTQLPTALRAVHQGGAVDGRDTAAVRALMAPAVAESCYRILALFHLLAFPDAGELTARSTAATGIDSAVGSLAEVPAWCAAGTALLRSLPHVAALLELASHQANCTRGGLLSEAGNRLTFTLGHVVQDIFGFCMSVTSGGPWSAADAAAAGEALWQLHTALCRCIQLHAAGSLPLAGIQPVALLRDMSSIMSAAVCLCEAFGWGGDPATRGSISTASATKPRHLLAMSVAHAEAAMTAAAHQPMRVVLMSQAVEFGPPALLSTLPLRRELEQAAVHHGALEEATGATALVHTQLASLPHREPQPGDALELAQVAATRSCAYLCCANLAGEGGPAAGQGAGSQRCSKCRVAWYCGTACSHADWRAGHRRVCRALGAARAAEQQVA